MKGVRSEPELRCEAGPVSAATAAGLETETAATRYTEPSPPGLDRLVGEDERYLVVREIAHGGGGRVLRARDRRLGRDVALKVPFDARGEARLQREASITARLEHPAIVPVHDAGRLPDGRVFFAMKLVAGRSLRDAVDEADGAAERLALLHAVIAVADALAYAHAQGVIHRDVKPHNVLVGSFGETALIDWGLAKPLGDAAPEESTPLGAVGSTQTGAVLGTPAYMPPEQARGEPVDARADVYGLGSLLYFVLSGRPPRGNTAPPADGDRPPPLDPPSLGVPPELCAIAEKAMAHDPGQRYAGARELAADLRRFQAGLLVGAYRYSRRARVRRFVRRNRAWLAVASLAVVALVAVGGVSVRRVVRDRAREARERAAAEALTGFALDDLRERLKPLARADLLRSLAESVSRYYEQLSQSAPLGPAEQMRWARALVHLGEVRREADLQEQAIASFQHARALFAAVAAASPGEVEASIGLAAAGARIADAELDSGRPAAALAEVRRAIEALEAIAAGPGPGQAWRRALADARFVEGGVLMQARELDAAAVSLGRALSLAEGLVRDAPADRSARELMARVHARMAMLGARGYEPEAVLGHAVACSEWTSRLLAAEPDAPAWLRLADSCSTFRGRAQADLRLLDAAAATAREVLEYSRRNARRDPENGLTALYLVLSLSALGNAEADLGRFDAARAALGEAASLAPALLRRDPLNARRALAALSAPIERARVELEAGQWQAALDTALTAAAESERAAASLPRDRNLAIMPAFGYMYQARALIGLGRTGAAVPLARRAVAALEQLMGEAPEDLQVQYELALGEGVLADALAGVAPEEAARRLQRAIALQDTLLAIRPQIGWRIARARLLARLAALEPPPAARAHLREALSVMTTYADGRLTFDERRDLASARAALARL